MNQRFVSLGRWVSAPALCACTVVASEGHAQSNPMVRLAYERGPGTEACPDEAELRQAVSARLGYDPFTESAKRSVLVRVVRRDRGLAGRIELRDEKRAIAGARDLTSPTQDCRELVSALSVAAAIGIDPIRGLSAAAPRSPNAPEVAPTEKPIGGPSSPPSPESPTKASGPEAAQDDVRFRGSVGALVALGSSPAPALGIAIGMGIRGARLSMNVEGRADLPSSADVTGGRVSASLLLANLVSCLHVRLLSGCLLGSIGAFRAEGQGVTNPLRVTKPFGGAGGRIAIELPTTSAFGVRIHADALAPVSETTLRLDNRDVWTTPPIAGAMGVAFIGNL